MSNSVAVITGGSRGIGAATAHVFAKNGYDIAITYRTDEIRVKETEKQLSKLGVKVLVLQADLAVESEVQDLFKNIMAEFGQVNVLVNNAGGADVSGLLLETSYKDWLTVFNSNVFSAVLCAKEAGKIMQQQEEIGRIINIASVLGEQYGGREGAIAYSAAKAAIINFTQTLAKDFAPKILVNAVSPGRTHTPYYDTMTEEKREMLKSANVIERFITPLEIAETIYFVSQNDAMAGETVTVGGGFFL